MSNMENLLDIDFDGAAPASAVQKEPSSNALTSLDGLAGTPVRVASPTEQQSTQPAASSNLQDLLGVFDSEAPTTPAQPQPPAGMAGASGDLLNGLGGLNLSSTAPTQPPAQGAPKSTQDIMDLF